MSRKSTIDENGKKSMIKFSIRNSLNYFRQIAQTAAEMEAQLQIIITGRGPIQPFILVVGSLLDPKQILVYFDNIKYKMFSVLKAFDTCFKIFHVFNLEYPIESANVWLFIQTYFYNITTKYDKSCALIKQITAELN